MTSTPGVLVDDNILEVLRKAQLDEFTNKFIFVFNVRRFEHFSHVRDKDMQDIGMEQPQIRQLREQILEMSREISSSSNRNQILVTANCSSVQDNLSIANDDVEQTSSKLPDISRGSTNASQNATISRPPIPTHVLTRAQKQNLYSMLSVFLNTLKNKEEREKQEKHFRDLIDPAPFQKPPRKKKIIVRTEVDIDFIAERHTSRNSIYKDDNNAVPDDHDILSFNGENYHNENSLNTADLYEYTPDQIPMHRSAFELDEMEVVREDPQNRHSISIDSNPKWSGNDAMIVSPEITTQSGNSENDDEAVIRSKYRHLSVFLYANWTQVETTIDKDQQEFVSALCKTGDEHGDIYEYVPLKRMKDRKYRMLHIPLSAGVDTFYAQQVDGALLKVCEKEYHPEDACYPTISHIGLSINQQLGIVEIVYDRTHGSVYSAEIHGPGLVVWKPARISGIKTLLPFELKIGGEYCLTFRANHAVAAVKNFTFEGLGCAEADAEEPTICFSLGTFWKKQFDLTATVQDTHYNSLPHVIKHEKDLTIITSERSTGNLDSIKLSHGQRNINGGYFSFGSIYSDMDETEPLEISSVGETSSVGEINTPIAPKIGQRKREYSCVDDQEAGKSKSEDGINQMMKQICVRLLNIIPEGTITSAMFDQAMQFGQLAVHNFACFFRSLRPQQSPVRLSYRIYNFELRSESAEEKKAEIRQILHDIKVIDSTNNTAIEKFGRLAKTNTWFSEFSLVTITNDSTFRASVLSKFLEYNKNVFGGRVSEYLVFGTSIAQDATILNTLLLNTIDQIGVIESKKLWINDGSLYENDRMVLSFEQVKLKYMELLVECAKGFQGNVRKRAFSLLHDI